MNFLESTVMSGGKSYIVATAWTDRTIKSVWNSEASEALRHRLPCSWRERRACHLLFYSYMKGVSRWICYPFGSSVDCASDRGLWIVPVDCGLVCRSVLLNHCNLFWLRHVSFSFHRMVGSAYEQDGRRPFELVYHGRFDESRPRSNIPVTGR